MAGLGSLAKFTPAQRDAIRILELHKCWNHALTWPVGLGTARHSRELREYQVLEELHELKTLVVKVEDRTDMIWRAVQKQFTTLPTGRSGVQGFLDRVVKERLGDGVGVVLGVRDVGWC
jgi:hypothetical protein